MSGRLKLLILVACVMANGSWQPARCAEVAPSADRETDAPIRFRRVHAPADRIADWPFGGEKYVPIDATEFESLLEAVRSDSPSKEGAHCTSARYEARLVGRRLVSGRATLQIDHASKSPVLLALEPCNLAIGKATWMERPPVDGESVSEEPIDGEPADNGPIEARLGTGMDGRLAVLVAGSGELNFDWSLGARQVTAKKPGVSGAITFHLQLPRGPTKSLLLEIPRNLVPTVDNAVVLPAEEEETDGPTRRWRIDLGGRGRFDLRIVRAGAAAFRPKLAMCRESIVYDFALPGVNVAADLNLEVHDEPLRQVRLVLDRPLRLVSAKCGDDAIRWSVLPSDGSDVSRVVLTLPEPVHDSECVLRLDAVAPLTLDRQWQLPRIRPENLFWQEGDAHLLVPAPLVLDRLVTVGCRQTGTGSLSAPRIGESARFQLYSPDGTVGVVLSRQESAIRMLGATVVELSEAEMNASVRAKFTTTRGERFEIEADVASQWLIDSVESESAEAIDDWTLDKPAGNGRRLTVRLARGISPDRPVLLRVAARKLQSPLGRRLTLRDMLPLKFRVPRLDDASDGDQLVAVDAVGPYRVTLSGTERPRQIDPHDLDAEQRALFSELPRNTLFRNDADATDSRFVLESQPPSYEGKIRVEAVVRDGRLRESYTLRCFPKTSQRVSDVLVHFSRRRDSPIRWTLGADDQRRLSARRLTVDEQRAIGLPPEEETWRLTLLRPRNVDFEIHAVRDVESADRQQVSLASLPEAADQQGVLVVRSLGCDALGIDNRGLKPIPSETVPPNRCRTVRATYRYAPGDPTATSEAAVVLSPSAKANTPSAWVWDCRLESRYETGGDSRHLAVYRLQSSAAARLRLTLPDSVRAGDVYAVWIDDRRVDGITSDPSARHVTIDLPANERFPTVSIEFTMPRTGLGIVGALRPPLPRPDLPILDRHWTVWLPPGYEAYDPDPRWQPLRSSPPTWRQRVFGGIAREAGQSPFDPTHADDWSLSTSDRAASADGMRQARQLLQTLGELASGKTPASEQGTSNGAVDWATLLGHESVETLALTLLIDRHAMARSRIGPSDSVRSGIGGTPSARGVSLLQKNGLAMLVHRKALLLTTQADAALYRAHLSPMGSHGLWWVRPGPLSDQLEHSAVSSQEGSLVSIDGWRRSPARPKVLWTRGVSAGREAADLHGWSAYRLETPDLSPVRLKFVHAKSFRLFGAVTFVLVGALGWWIGRRDVLVLIVSGGLFGLIAMLVPAAYVPIASGAVLATLFCLILRLVRSGSAIETEGADASGEEVPSTIGAVAKQIGTAMLAVAMLNALVGEARGQDQQTPPESESPIHRVFFPIDENEQPDGDKVYVPTELYDQLYRRAASGTDNPQGWLIAGATYRGRLSRSTESGQLVVDRLQVGYRLLVFDHTKRIRIPLGRRGANLVPHGALLDGQTVRPEWEPDGEAILIDVDQPGQCRLELTLQPTVRSIGGSSQFDLSIPRLAVSRLEFDLPPGPQPSIDVPQAGGNLRFVDDPPQVSADLGPCDRLTFRFNDGRSAGNGAAVDVESLLWLNVQPGSVVVDAKFKVRVVEGRVRALRLATDPRMRLLPLQGDAPPTTKIESTPGEPQRLTLQWPEPIAEEEVVHARFLLTGTSGVGNLRLPALDVLDARSIRRWMAVSVDTALDHQEQGNDELDRVPVSDFEDHWGPSEKKPRVAYDLAVEKPPWSLATWPREPRTAIDQRLTLSLAADHADIRFRAQMVNSAGYDFQHRLAVPPSLRIRHLSVLQDGVERVSRWSKDETGLVTIFLTGPIDGRQELLLAGRIPIATKRRWNLPTIRIDHGQWKPEAIDVQSSVIRVFRQPSVLVAIKPQAGLTPVEDVAVAAEDRQFGRLIGWFRAEPKGPARAAVTLSRNQPRVRADQITRVRKDGDSWLAEIDCRLHATDGLIDECRLEIPGSFAGPYRITGDPTAEVRAIETPGETSLLIVRPTSPIDGAYAVTIRGPLDAGANGRCRVPRIELQRVDSLRRMVALPNEADGRPIAWETFAMRELPSNDQTSALIDTSAFTLYEVLADTYEATVGPADQPVDAARVRLADLRFDWQIDGTCQGVALFDVEPGNMRRCPLRLPDGIALIHVAVAGIPTQPVPTGKGAWQIRLGPEGLPQRIEVVFHGRLPESLSSTRRFEPPAIGDLPVERTLWTIAGPSMFEPGTSDAVTPVMAYRHDLIRLKNVGAMIESASNRSVDDAEDLLRWYRLWAARFTSARSTLQGELAASTGGRHVEEVKAELQAIDRQQARIAARLETTKLLTQLSETEAVADDPGELWRWWLDRPRTATRCVVEGASAPLTLSYQAAKPGEWRYRLFSAGGLLLAVAVAVVAVRRGTPAAWFRAWSGTFGIVFGLAWWLWLSPSILGWVIVLASLIASMLPRLPRTRPVPDSSVVSVHSTQR